MANVNLIGCMQDSRHGWESDDFPVAGAMGCFSNLSSDALHTRHKIAEVPYMSGNKELDWEKAKKLILEETSGRGHGAVLDQGGFVFSLDDVSRASTLALCGPLYAAHLQQSLRRATAERGSVSVGKREDDLMREQFKLYGEMQAGGIPSEDARFILPLGTKTTIQTQWGPRELMHLKAISQEEGVPDEVKEVADKMYELAENAAPETMKDRGVNYNSIGWYPSPFLFAKQNRTLEGLAEKHGDNVTLLDSSSMGMSPEAIEEAIGGNYAELANLQGYAFNLLAPMSLAAFHQATRQRTWRQSVDALPSAVKRGEYITPPTIKETEFESGYRDLVEQSLNTVMENIDDPNTLLAIPHALQVYNLMNLDGWNAISAISSRTCEKAQWEIRKVTRDMAAQIKDAAPEIGKYAAKRGELYGGCPERNPCGRCPV